jgi:hypothetical protein
VTLLARTYTYIVVVWTIRNQGYSERAGEEEGWRSDFCFGEANEEGRCDEPDPGIRAGAGGMGGGIVVWLCVG